ncbi:uncharacterized protein LOC131266736 [Anopheles coustani]|uniref:uncharacterized protein LOC131266736 n=1 Tax=Anopheles coustani TaxID=139045 RepID=UPI0026593E44|nr:uncharacterized protein LOC131266736 [Anopheles coustani]
MDQTYSIWPVNTGQTSGNVGSSIIAAAVPPGRQLRIVNIGSQITSDQLMGTGIVTTGGSRTVYGIGTSEPYQQHSTGPIMLQMPETRQYIVDESSIQNIDQMPPVNLIMDTSTDACDGSSLVVAEADNQVYHLATESTGEVPMDEYSASKMMQSNDVACEQETQYAEECEVMEEVITDDWVQSQGEECVQVTVDQLGASTIAGQVEDDISVPLDQDEYTLSRPFPCDFCSRRFRKKANLEHHLVAHSNDRPYVCNLCGAQYGRRIDLTNHFKQHAYATSNLDETTALRSDDIDYDILPMTHHSKQRAHQSSDDEDLFNEGTRAVNYNAQPPMQLISSTNSTTTTSSYGGIRLQYSNDPTVATMSTLLEDGSFSYDHSPPTTAESNRSVSSARKARQPDATSSPRRQASRAGKSVLLKGSRRNAAPNNSYIKKEPGTVTNVIGDGFLPPLDEGTTLQQPAFPVVDERKPFVCQQCGVSFGREKALASHSRVHGGDMQFRCTTCDERFWDRMLLQDHIRQKHPDVFHPQFNSGGGPKRSVKTHKTSSFVVKEERVSTLTNDAQQQFVCDSCHMVFDRPEQLKKHIQLAHGPTAVVVSDNTIVKRELCEMILDAVDQNIGQDDIGYMIDYEDQQSKSDLAAQEQDQHQQPLFCRHCGVAFTKKSDLLAHTSKICIRNEPHECQLCGVKFPNEIVIKQHIQECHRHELTDSSCAICGKLCKNQNSLMKHSYDHSRERVHCCSKCGKTFHHMGRLKRHMGSHRNKTVRCEVCGEEFPDGRSLMNHRHSHSKSNNYPCKECGKTFGSRSSQQIHLRLHTGERPYACRFCWKAFADGGTLRKHERVHTGEKPYGCSVCPKEFNQRVVLREHIRAHHSQPEPKRGSAELPYYCPVCSSLFATGPELVQHLIEHSDTNTAMKRKPPTYPRKYKRRRKLKPHELERLQSGRRRQKAASTLAAGEEDDDDEENEQSLDDDDGGNDDQQRYERTMVLEREDGTLKTPSELFYEYGGGDSSKAQKLTVASSKFISPYELLAEGATSSGSGRARKRDLSTDSMIDDIGINLLSNGNSYPRADLANQRPSTTTTMSSKFNNNDHKEESSMKRRAGGVKGAATVASKSPMAVGMARMIHTEPANKRTPATKANGDTKRVTSRAKRTVAHSSTKEHIHVPPREIDGNDLNQPSEVGSVSHAMEAFSELERNRSHVRGPVLPSYVREIPSSRISENFPLLDDGNTIDTMEEQLIEGCLDEARATLRQRYGGGSRQRFISTASSGISGTREEEDEQLLMEISRGEKYTDRFNSDIVNDLAEILRSPLKATSSSAATTTTSVPPVDILASPSSRHAVLLPPIVVKQEKTFFKKEPLDASDKKKAQRKKTASNRVRNKARVQSTPSKQQQQRVAVASASSTTLSDPYANSLLYSHGRRLTRRQLEREVSFLREAFAPGGLQETDTSSNVIGNEGTSAGVVESTFSTGGDRLAAATPVVIKQENVVPEKLAEMLLNDGIALGAGSTRSSSRSSDNDESVLVGAMAETTKHKQRQHGQEEGSEDVKLTTTSGYRCSICAAYFADRSQLILHVPVHM